MNWRCGIWILDPTFMRAMYFHESSFVAPYLYQKKCFILAVTVM